jgi:TonB family protein
MICNPMWNSVGVKAYCRLAFSLAMLLPAWAGVVAQASAGSTAAPTKAACDLLTAKEASDAIGLPVERVPPPSGVGWNMCWFAAVPSEEDSARTGDLLAKSVAVLINPCEGSFAVRCAGLMPDPTQSSENHTGATVEKVDSLGESARFITESGRGQKFIILNVRMQQSVIHLQLMSTAGEFLPGRKPLLIEAMKLILARAAEAPASSQAAPTAEAAKSVNISDGSAAGMLLHRTSPVYPPEAKAAHVTGTVVLQGTISKTGSMEDLRVISGPPMLQQSAIDAVKTWVYRPYLLNGNPAAVQTTVSVAFTMDASPVAPASPSQGNTSTNEQAASGQPQRPAETAPAQANTPVGHWVAEHPSKGGIGSWWEFRPDGSLTMHAGVVVTFPITRSGNTMTRPGDTVNGPPRHFTFQVVGETLHLIQNVYEMAGVSEMAAFRQKAPDYKGPETIDMAYSRVGAAPSAADPLLGQWKPVPAATPPSTDPGQTALQKMAANSITLFSADGTESLRMPFSSIEGTWDASAHTFHYANQATVFSFERTGAKLTLGQPPNNTQTDTYLPDPFF